MAFANPGADEMRDLLKRVKTIAVVGLSPKSDRPSHGVAKALQRWGYRIVPVRPATAEVLGGTADPGPSGRPGRPARPDRFLAGAFVADRAGDRFDPDRYRAELAAVQAAGGTPVVFPSHGLNALEERLQVGRRGQIASGRQTGGLS